MKSNFKFEKNNHWPGKFDGNDDCKNILQWNTITDDTERRAIKTVNFPMKTTPNLVGKKIFSGVFEMKKCCVSHLAYRGGGVGKLERSVTITK